MDLRDGAGRESKAERRQDVNAMNAANMKIINFLKPMKETF